MLSRESMFLLKGNSAIRFGHVRIDVTPPLPVCIRSHPALQISKSIIIINALLFFLLI